MRDAKIECEERACFEKALRASGNHRAWELKQSLLLKIQIFRGNRRQPLRLYCSEALQRSTRRDFCTVQSIFP